MIQANELRVGNWLIYGDVYTTVTCIEHDDNLDCFFGIPLTPEILEKCGFEKMKLRPSDDHDYMKDFDLEGVDTNGYNVFYKITDDFILGGLRDDDISWSLVYENAGYDENAHIYTMGKQIDYLHQLQNLYWCLVGNELTIKL